MLELPPRGVANILFKFSIPDIPIQRLQCLCVADLKKDGAGLGLCVFRVVRLCGIGVVFGALNLIFLVEDILTVFF